MEGELEHKRKRTLELYKKECARKLKDFKCYTVQDLDSGKKFVMIAPAVEIKIFHVLKDTKDDGFLFVQDSDIEEIKEFYEEIKNSKPAWFYGKSESLYKEILQFYIEFYETAELHYRQKLTDELFERIKEANGTKEEYLKSKEGLIEYAAKREMWKLHEPLFEKGAWFGTTAGLLESIKEAETNPLYQFLE